MAVSTGIAEKRRLQAVRGGDCEGIRAGGAEGDRTPDLVIANDALSHLSYGPVQYRMAARACSKRQVGRY